MKILHVNVLYPPFVWGGAERSVQTLAEALAHRGHQVWVLSQTPEPHPQKDLINGVHVIRWPTQNLYFPYPSRRPPAPLRLLWHSKDTLNPQVARKTLRLLQELQPDLVHTHLLIGFSVSVWWAVHRRRIPLVHTLRDHYLLCARSSMYKHGRNCKTICAACRPFVRPRREMSALVDGVIGPSRFILRRHLNFGYFPHAQWAVIPHGVEIPPETEIPPSPPIPPLRFGYLGRLDPYKGIELLLEVFHRWQEPSAELWIAGRSMPETYGLSLKDRYAHDRRIRWLGVVHPSELFQQIHVLVVPTLIHETLARVILEANAYGIPVIAAHRGGIPEEVREGETGFLFDPDRPETLEQWFRHIRKNPRILEPMRQKARRWGEAFSIDRMIEAHLDFYRRIVYHKHQDGPL